MINEAGHPWENAVRQVEKFRIDQSRTASREGREVVLDASLLDDSTNAGPMPRSTVDGGDVIAGLRNGLLLSAAFWVLVYFCINLLLL
jgi:hypothetical protein